MNGEMERKRWENFWGVIRGEERPSFSTERASVWKKNKATLWYYPATNKKFTTPIYLIYSLVNQPFILDLYPSSSFIGALVQQGYDVYLIDFGIPGYEDKDRTIDYYVSEYIQKGAQQALGHSKAKELTVMGFCLGGTLAAIYASIADEPIRNLILDVAPIDFSSGTSFDEWVRTIVEEDLEFDSLVDTIGLIPSPVMEAGIRLMTSPIYYSPYLALLNKADDPEYVARWQQFNRWTKEHIPLPGGVVKQLITDFIKGNKLVNGLLIVNDKKVNLSNIHANLLVLAAENDQLVPKETTYKIMELVSSTDKKYQLVQGGHTTLPKNGQLPDYLQTWLELRS